MADQDLVLHSKYGAEFYEKNGKKYGKFFLVNGSMNLMKWQVPPENIEPHLKSFIGMPYISEPNFEHMGFKPTTPVEEIIRKQESARVGTIVDTPFDKKRMEAYAVVEFHDDKVFEELKQGIGIYTSPAITGFPNPDILAKEGKLVYDNIWYGLHLARVKSPAYGVMNATMKTLCEGEACLKSLTATAAAAMAKLGLELPSSSSEHQQEQLSLDYSMTTGKTVEQLEKENADLASQVASLSKDLASFKTQAQTASAFEKQIDDMKSQLASFHKEKKDKLVSEIASMKVDGDLIEAKDRAAEIDSLSKLDVKDLESQLASISPAVAKIKALKTQSASNSQGTRSNVVREVRMPTTGTAAAKEPIRTIEQSRELFA